MKPTHKIQISYQDLNFVCEDNNQCFFTVDDEEAIEICKLHRDEEEDLLNLLEFLEECKNLVKKMLPESSESPSRTS